MRDVGDRHDQPPPAAALRLGIHRVIEVARVGTVDRHQRQLADVGAAFAFGRGHHGFHLRRIAQHFGRPLVRQVVTGDRHFHYQRRLQAFAQHRADLAHRAALRRRWCGDLDDHDLAGSGALLLARLDHHVLVQAAIVRRHQSHAVLDQDPTDQPRRAAFQHLRDRALLAPAAVDADHAGEHAVTMHHRTHLLRRQVQVVAAFVGTQEAVTLGIGQHAAGDQVELLRGRITATAAQQQLAIADHRAQALAQRVEVGFVSDLQRFSDARLGQQLGALFEQGENGLTAGDRARITLRLAVGMRIAHGACGSLGALV